jgi:hypothetical protein
MYNAHCRFFPFTGHFCIDNACVIDGKLRYIERFIDWYCIVNTVCFHVKTCQLMLYREITAVCSEKYTNCRHSICGLNVEFLVLNLVVHKVTTGFEGLNHACGAIFLCKFALWPSSFKTQ